MKGEFFHCIRNTLTFQSRQHSGEGSARASPGAVRLSETQALASAAHRTSHHTAPPSLPDSSSGEELCWDTLLLPLQSKNSCQITSPSYPPTPGGFNASKFRQKIEALASNCCQAGFSLLTMPGSHQQ